MHSEHIQRKIDQNYQDYEVYKKSSFKTETYTYLIGFKVHLKSTLGMYSVVKANKNKFCITCRSWGGKVKWVFNHDFHCFAKNRFGQKIKG